MMAASLHLLLGLCLVSTSLAAKVVMMPMFSGSHYIVMAKLADELATRGHKVEILVGDSEKAASEKKPHVRVFKLEEKLRAEVSSVKPYEPGKKPDVGNMMKSIVDMSSLQSRYCSAFLTDKSLMEEIKNADVVIGDSLYLCSSMVAANFSIPLVTIVISTLVTPTLHAYGVHNPPAYTIQMFPGIPGKLSFFQRAQSAIGWIGSYFVFHFVWCPPYKEIKVKHNIAPHESFMDTIGRIDLIIAQVDFPIDVPRPLLPNTKVVGSLTSSPAKPLSQELEEFMQSSGEAGVVLVSFGTVVGSDEKLVELLATALSKLPQKVIWKTKESPHFKVGTNVKMMSWLPQNDILGHNKVKLFFGHGGINGLLEAIYHGVPMVIAPFFADQPINGAVAKYNGIGEMVDLTSMTADELVKVISNVISDPSYNKNVLRLSRMMKLKPRPPVSEAADWVEYLIAVGSLAHLRPRELDMPFYQLYMLDVMLAAVIFLLVVLLIVRFIVKGIAKCLCASKKKEKTH